MRLSRLLSAFVVVIGVVIACEDDPVSVVCFRGGTPILTPSGSVAIETLDVGDAVICVDPNTGSESTAKVRSNRAVTADEYLVIRTVGGRHVEVTRHHPFWNVEQSEFREIGEFAPGDGLLVRSDDGLRVDRIQTVDAIRHQAAVYDLEIDSEPHTFVASDIVVHNKPPTGPKVDVVMRVEPDNSGWIRAGDRFVGQGADTVLILRAGSVVALEAVPRNGWMFSFWEGDVFATDTFVVHFEVQLSGNRVTCFFEPTP